MWLAASIIAFTEGGADAEGGAIARPPGMSSAVGTAAPATVAAAPSVATVPRVARRVFTPLRMKVLYRQLVSELGRRRIPLLEFSRCESTSLTVRRPFAPYRCFPGRGAWTSAS